MVKKKLMSFLIAIVSIFAMFGLSSCNNAEKDILTEHERAFLDTFVENMLSSYKDPTSVIFVNVKCSLMDGGIVRFTTSAKNGFGGNVQGEYFLVTASFSATEYYVAADLDLLLDEETYTQYYSKGKFYSSDSLTASVFFSKDKTATALYVMKERIDLGIDHNLKDENLTYNIANLNSALADYKTSQGW
ncbi:MAG: hypothetical protein K2N65_06505 [Anaeroplasmataceae bacterium]|nr:hypothetical protein [Anaeroplasmataceae bacterium]